MELVPLFGASIGAWLALATIGPAEADCVTSCMAGKGCGLQYESGRVQPGYCSIAQTDCEEQCRRGEGSGVKDGAIAFSAGTNARGDSYRYGSLAEAECRALAECAKNARDCTVAVWFSDNCCTVASAEGSIWAGGLGRSEAAATNDAIADCHKRGGKKRAMQHAVCSPLL
jgi:serine/threonine-protein kinase